LSQNVTKSTKKGNNCEAKLLSKQKNGTEMARSKQNKKGKRSVFGVWKKKTLEMQKMNVK